MPAAMPGVVRVSFAADGRRNRATVSYIVRGTAHALKCPHCRSRGTRAWNRLGEQMSFWAIIALRAVGRVTASFLLLAAPAMAAESPAELISSFRLKHGEPRVVRDATLDRIALEQAQAMAAKNDLSHEVLGSFTKRVAPARAGRAAENIAYGYESFEKTLGQWIDSSGHRKNLLLQNASRVGIASAKDASGKRTYWAMVIAGDYEPKPRKAKKEKEPVVALKRETAPSGRSKATTCRIKVLSLCI